MEVLLKLAQMKASIDLWYEKQAKRTTADPAGERQNRVKNYQRRQEQAEVRRMKESRKYHARRPSISKDKPKKIVECFNEKTKKWGPCAPASSPKASKPKVKSGTPNFGLPPGI